MNKVILIGHLAADPESRTTQSGVAQCTLRLAVQRRFTDKQSGKRESDFFNVVCWRQTAEFVNKYALKGRKVAIEGSLQTRSYDAQDGSKRYVTEIVADRVELLGSKKDPQSAPAPAPAQPQQRFKTTPLPVDDDDLPEGDGLPF